MCTVVVRWSPARPLQVLALRDELVGREFDDPGPWWPAQPTVIGGRDRVAGGSWCVTDIATGTAALVLNRPQRKVAAAGAPSRGVLPLLAVRHGERWPEEVDTSGMASFALVLAGPTGLREWEFDGELLTSSVLGEGTHMVTSGGAEDRKGERYLDGFAGAGTVQDWRVLVEAHPPQDDPAALVVRHEEAGRVFATVFGQVFTATAGRLAVSASREPWREGTWTERVWT